MNRRYSIAVVVAGLVLTLGGASSWGRQPPDPTASDSFGNTAGGTNALVNDTPSGGFPETGSGNTALGFLEQT